MRLSMKKNKTSRKSRMSRQPIISTKSNTRTPDKTPITEYPEQIKNFYITSMLKRKDLDDPIMCVFTNDKKEISFESEGTTKIKVKIHGNSTYPLTESFTFLQLERLFKDYIKKKADK